MPAVNRVLVVGAGVAGSAAGIFLAQAGVSVDLVDQSARTSTHGSGITLQGNALRVLRQLGVWEQLNSQGFAFTSVGIRAPNPEGTLVGEFDDVLTGGDDLPATLGIPRPALAATLLARASEVGCNIRWSRQFQSMEEGQDGVTVTFADGDQETYDLVVGADGVHSRVRAAMGIATGPVPTGMAIWRIFAPRPESIVRTDLVYGGQSYIAGYCPTSADSLYAYIVEDADPANFELSTVEKARKMRELSQAYHGPWDDLRGFIADDRDVNYTLFESHIVDGRWNRGRAVIIGDAAHSCPPTLAQGAALGLEDAAVLAELLIAATDVDDDLWRDFELRRLERAKTVVDASVLLGRWQMDHDPDANVPALMAKISNIVRIPA
ncbi:MAG: FAD-dependent monooxygenase [Lacisediminihabitans sp.]